MKPKQPSNKHNEMPRSHEDENKYNKRTNKKFSENQPPKKDLHSQSKENKVEQHKKSTHSEQGEDYNKFDRDYDEVDSEFEKFNYDSKKHNKYGEVETEEYDERSAREIFAHAGDTKKYNSEDSMENKKNKHAHNTRPNPLKDQSHDSGTNRGSNDDSRYNKKDPRSNKNN